jgi:hypothetical protein
MKKLLALSIIFVATAFVFSSCKVCTECTEAHTGTTSEYCGTKSQVNTYEKELKDQGSNLGQSWTCEQK